MATELPGLLTRLCPLEVPSGKICLGALNFDFFLSLSFSFQTHVGASLITEIILRAQREKTKQTAQTSPKTTDHHPW